MLLTIITVNRNNAQGLGRTINSVLPVLQGDVAYIIMDGASTDDSVEQARQLLLGHAQVRLFSEPDAGIYDAMNKGARMANSRFIAYVNSGDELDPVAYQAYLDFLRNTTAEVAYAKTNLRSLDGVHLGIHERHPQQLSHDTLPHLTTAVSLDLFNRLGGFDQQYRICSDRDLFVRARAAGATFAFFDRVVAIFELGGLSSSPQTKLEDLHINRRHGFMSARQYWRKRLSLAWRVQRDRVRDRWA